MDFFLNLIIIFSYHAILAIGLMYVAGFSGTMSFAQGAFLAVGAYSYALLITTVGWSFFPAMFAGFIITGIVAWLISYPVLKLKDDSLMFVTFAFAIIVFNLLLNFRGLTNGALGIKGIPKPEIFGFSFDTNFSFMILSIVCLIGVFLLYRWIVKSPYGTVLRGIRENEVVMQVSAYDAKRYARSAFVVGAAFMVFAGMLRATHIGFIEPRSFDLMASVQIVIMVLIGGLGNIWGALVGAAIVVMIPEALRFVGIPDAYLAESQQIIYGVILILLMYKRPQGIVGNYKL